jgi:hypothetical protein
MAAPEWASPSFLPGHQGLMDPAQGSISWLSWWLDIQVALLKVGIAQSYGEGLLDYLRLRVG